MFGCFRIKLRIKVRTRLNETFFRRIRVKVQNHLITHASSCLPFGIEVAAIFPLRIQGIGVINPKMMTVTLKIAADRQSREIICDNRITGQNARRIALDEIGVNIGYLDKSAPFFLSAKSDTIVCISSQSSQAPSDHARPNLSKIAN